MMNAVRIAMRHGALWVSRLTTSGLHPVGGVAGLILQVSKAGSSWDYVHRFRPGLLKGALSPDHAGTRSGCSPLP
jgi:hypothetical protein